MLKLGRFSFGATTAIITSVGLVAGLNYGADAKAHIVGGLLIIALADNVSDSFGIHVYKESETSDRREVLVTTLGNFAMRLCVTLSFIVLTLLLPAGVLVWGISVWGLSLLALLSVSISRAKGRPMARELILHLAVATLVILGSRYLGLVISRHVS
jgi:hypothetical protein